MSSSNFVLSLPLPNFTIRRGRGKSPDLFSFKGILRTEYTKLKTLGRQEPDQHRLP